MAQITHRSRSLRLRGWTVAVYVSVAAWAIAAYVVVRRDFYGFEYPYYDLGNMVQAVWSTAQGRPLESTLSTGEQAVRLAGHVDPILVLFAPLSFLAPTPLVLSAIQVVAVALGALPVYWLARRHLKPDVAPLLAFAYLAYPWIAWSAFDAVHPVTLAIPLILFAIYFLDSEKLFAFALCALLIAATNELAGLFVAGIGAWYFISRGRRGRGAAILTAGLAWTAVCLWAVIPAFSDGENLFYSHYTSVGGSPTGLVRTLLSDPGAIVDALTSSDDIAYVLWLLAPLLASPLLSPAIALMALPQLGINMLADLHTTTDPRHHYVAGAVPFLVAGTIFGIARLRQSLQLAAGAAVLASSVALGWVLGPWPGLPGPTPSVRPRVSAEHARALRSAVELIPEGVAISTSPKAGSHLAERRYVFQVPIVKSATWIVLDMTDDFFGIAGSLEEGRHPERLRAFHKRIREDVSWVNVFSQDDVFVYRLAEGPRAAGTWYQGSFP